MSIGSEIFGLALAPLYFAIAQVESDRGATSANVYQIRRIYVDDVNRIWLTPYRYEDVNDPVKSRAMMRAYWLYYGTRYRKISGKLPDYEVLARIHNGGPNGWRNPATLAYWQRVKAWLPVVGKRWMVQTYNGWEDEIVAAECAEAAKLAMRAILQRRGVRRQFLEGWRTWTAKEMAVTE